MIDAIQRLVILAAIFGTVFLVAQVTLDYAFTKGAHLRAVNKRLRMIKEGSSREEILTELRKNAPQTHENLPPFLARRMQNYERMLMALGVSITPSQLVFFMGGGFILVTAVLLLLIAGAGYALGLGTIFLVLIFAFCVAFLLPTMLFNMMATRRRKKVEEQFPVALDVFVRALRAGHPIASGIELLTNEMEDPIGSEFGLVSDEVAYGAELTDALTDMAERWDLEDIRMFVVSLSVQQETGGNLAEILQNLSEVIRARAALYMKVRALSSEGRMTGIMLSVLPVVAFIGLFLVNPEFYLSVAQDTMFIVGAIVLAVMYFTGVMWIKSLVNLKV